MWDVEYRGGNKWHYIAAVQVKQYKCHAFIFKNWEVLQKSLRYNIIINFNNYNNYSVHNYYSIAQFVFQSQYTAYEQQNYCPINPFDFNLST